MKLMTRASRAPGRFVGRNDLGGHRFDLDRLFGREELELHRLAGLRGLQHVVLGGQNARVVRRDPGAAEARRGIEEKGSS